MYYTKKGECRLCTEFLIIFSKKIESKISLEQQMLKEILKQTKYIYSRLNVVSKQTHKDCVDLKEELHETRNKNYRILYTNV